jgi:hypothetical protein
MSVRVVCKLNTDTAPSQLKCPSLRQLNVMITKHGVTVVTNVTSLRIKLLGDIFFVPRFCFVLLYKSSVMNESSIKSKPCTGYERVADICLVQKISADERAPSQNSSSVFPRWSIIRSTPIAFDRPMSEVIHYSFLPVKGFSKDEWCEVWGGEEVGIDECLSRNPHRMKSKFPRVFQETEFLTIPFRLIIDPAKTYQLPRLSRGTIISFANCNSQSHRYIIDTCVFSNSNDALYITSGDGAEPPETSGGCKNPSTSWCQNAAKRGERRGYASWCRDISKRGWLTLPSSVEMQPKDGRRGSPASWCRNLTKRRTTRRKGCSGVEMRPNEWRVVPSFLC